MINDTHTVKEFQTSYHNLPQIPSFVPSAITPFKDLQDSSIPKDLEKIREIMQNKINVELIGEVNKLTKELNELKNKVSPKIVYIEEMDYKTAEKKVIDYFKENNEADLEELLDNLNIDMEMLIEITDKLMEKGRIKVSTNE